MQTYLNESAYYSRVLLLSVVVVVVCQSAMKPGQPATSCRVCVVFLRPRRFFAWIIEVVPVVVVGRRMMMIIRRRKRYAKERRG
jgi:hypothetical protein